MTREEKMAILKDIINGEIINPQVRKDVGEWAIKALEQEPTIKNDLAVDCISRADVLKLMQDNWHTHNGDWAMQESMDDIRVLPSVTPQPRKGHWISTETKGVRYAFWCRYKCSLCGGRSDHTNFCPNCGANMVEPQESEE